jgi:hypothetical protein
MVQAEHQLQCKVILDEAMDYGENQTVKLNPMDYRMGQGTSLQHVRGI